jgi:hypothetical protein
MAAGEMTDAELVAEIERLERLWNGLRKRACAVLNPHRRQAPTLFEVGRRLDQIDREWRLWLRRAERSPP